MKEPRVPRDQLLRCTECGTEFLYSAGEQRRRQTAQTRGLPERCPGCQALHDLVEAVREEDVADAGGESGSVKWYDRRKGFGFLVSDGGEHFFFHRSSLPRGTRAPRRGAVVRFRRTEGQRGLEAQDVRPAAGRPAAASDQSQTDIAEETITHGT